LTTKARLKNREIGRLEVPIAIERDIRNPNPAFQQKTRCG
jgi:hypothetical protein